MRKYVRVAGLVGVVGLASALAVVACGGDDSSSGGSSSGGSSSGGAASSSGGSSTSSGGSSTSSGGSSSGGSSSGGSSSGSSGDAGADSGDAGQPPPATYAIGGSVSGLAGTGLVLQNGAETVSPTADGSFSFPTHVVSGTGFAVTVKTQPTNPSQNCTVTGGTGTVAAGDVTTVVVNCATNKFTVGGNVSGLTGTGLVLQNNGGSDLAVNANGTFAFPTQNDGTAYAVTVKTSASGQDCTVTSGSGTLAGANVTNVSVTCAAKQYSVSGTLTGLGASNESVVLQNNAGNDLSLNKDGTFTFTNKVSSGGGYNVTVKTQPADFTCTASANTGPVIGSDITSVKVDCVPKSCKAVLLATPAAATGSYMIQPVSSQYNVYCDMTGGAGWTLMMKGAGTNNTFTYAASYWTSNNTLNPSNVNLTAADAKYQSFNEVPATQIRVTTLNSQGSGELTIPNPQTKSTLLAMFNAGDFQTYTPLLGKLTWLQSQGGVYLQPNCNQEGVNLNGAYAKARIGFLTNQENDCNTPDSIIGIGIVAATSCGNTGGPFSAGFYTAPGCGGWVNNQNQPSGTPPYSSIGADFYVWGR